MYGLGKKITNVPRDEGPYIRCFVIYLDFPLNNHMAKHDVVSGARATTAQFYLGQDTLEFDQVHVTKNQPITMLVLLRKSLVYNNCN